ncbi:hypothetical protein pb186bvf_013141 [Paramecium bursaria]
MKRDYYEVLGIEQNVDQEAIKKAYRVLALKLHPDKNPSEQAKQQFQEIQEAYQILSDPNERSWYDNHKQQILNPDKNNHDREEGFGFNIYFYFNPGFLIFDDSPQGFYAFYRECFEKIKYEEEQAYNNKVVGSDEEDDQQDFEKLPGFGQAITQWDQVLKFYQKWENFTTYKSFAYADKYNPNEAPNRQIKRLIIQDNLKERKEEKKKYIKTVKKLVDLVKQKDPRYDQYLQNKKKEDLLIEQQKKKQKELEKQRNEQILKEARILEQQRFEENEAYFKEKLQHEIVTEKIQKNNGDILYCEICDKEFKSESQLKNHQNSKIHKQNLKELVSIITSDKKEQEEILKNNGIIKPQQFITKEEELKQQVEQQFQKEQEKEQQKQQQQQEVKQKKKQNKRKRNKKKNIEDNNQDEDSDNEDNKKELKQNDQEDKQDDQQQKVEVVEEPQSDSDEDAFTKQMIENLKRNRQNKDKQYQKEEIIQPQKQSEKELDKVQQEQASVEKQQNNDNKDNEAESQSDGEGAQEKTQQPTKKPNKAKIKRDKKKEKLQNQQPINELQCNICKEQFPSKTKLFNHVNTSKHQIGKPLK